MTSMLPVTYLFVPGPEDRKVAKALASGADAVILDLEDAVPAAEKVAARAKVGSLIATIPATGPEVWIRINGVEPEFTGDVDGIDWSRVTGVVLPKADEPSRLERLARAGVRRILPLVETARGFDRLRDLTAASDRIERLAIGTHDLALDLGLHAIDDPDDSELIWQLRGELVVKSRALDLPPPIDGIFAAFRDDAGLRRVCTRGHQLGYGGKLLIHPDQLAATSSIFGTLSDRLDDAREIVTAYDNAAREGRGAIQVRGRLIDRVMADRARALLAVHDH